MAHGDRWVQPQPTEWARDCSSKPGVGYLKSAPLPCKDYTGTCGIRVYYVTIFENQAQRLSMWLNTHQDSEPGFSSKVAIHICHYSQRLLSFFNFTKPVMSHFFISKDHLQYFLHRSYALKPFSPAPTPPQKRYMLSVMTLHILCHLKIFKSWFLKLVEQSSFSPIL